MKDPCVFEPVEDGLWCSTHNTRHCWRSQRREYGKSDVDYAFQRGLEMGKIWWAGRSGQERYLGDALPYCPKVADAEKQANTLKRAAAVLEQRNARKQRFKDVR